MDNKVFLWHSKGSEESGQLLATLLDVDKGSVPPKGFEGLLVCYGAVPASNFKWEERKFHAIFNDPRKVRRYLDRKVLFDKLATEFSVPQVTAISKASTYDSVCKELLTGKEEGICLFKINGGDAKQVFSELGFEEFKGYYKYAAKPDFMRQDRTRAFVVGDTFVGALVQGNKNSPAFARQAAAEQTIVKADIAEKLIAHLLENGYVKPEKAFWQAQNAVHPNFQDAAIRAAKSLEYDFCAVDMCEEDGVISIMNVVTTPAILGHEVIYGAMASQIKYWLKRADKAHKVVEAKAGG